MIFLHTLASHQNCSRLSPEKNESSATDNDYGDEQPMVGYHQTKKKATTTKTTETTDVGNDDDEEKRQLRSTV